MEKGNLGIENTKEAIVAVNVLSIFIIKRLKDGIGFDDALALFSKITSDDEFMKVLKEAFDGVSTVPAELKDLQSEEVVELLTIFIGMIPDYLSAFNKEESK